MISGVTRRYRSQALRIVQDIRKIEVAVRIVKYSQLQTTIGVPGKCMVTFALVLNSAKYSEKANIHTVLKRAVNLSENTSLLIRFWFERFAKVVGRETKPEER